MRVQITEIHRNHADRRLPVRVLARAPFQPVAALVFGMAGKPEEYPDSIVSWDMERG